jgi:uncharacterized protein with HEPN domain
VPSSDPRCRFADIIREINLIEEIVGDRSQAAIEQVVQRMRPVPISHGRKIRSIGNVLRHAYDDVLFVRLWTTIKDDLPALRAACETQLS